MKVCVVGRGAREHALAYALSRTAKVVVAPGNPGTADERALSRGITSTDLAPEEVDADLFVIGPEAPLVDGLADRLRAKGHLVFGPSADGARLEGSKAFMKQLASDAGVPTARFSVADDLDGARSFLRSLPGPYVIKTDGLASGKGVLVTENFDEAVRDASDKLSGVSFGSAGRRVVIEEGLSGDEVSLLVVCDGHNVVALPPARDYKRVGEHDRGPNTGGMGAFSSDDAASADVVGAIMDTIVAPTLSELQRRGIDYRGVLYAGCMLTAGGPKLIEYNVRFGDPEAEVVLPRITSDLAELLASAAAGRIRTGPVVDDGAAVCVVLAASGYPASPRTGDRIEGIEAAAESEGVIVFHGGTDRAQDGVLRTAGGRVLVISGTGEDIVSARNRAYGAIEKISFDGQHFRRDIAELSGHNVKVDSTNVIGQL